MDSTSWLVGPILASKSNQTVFALTFAPSKVYLDVYCKKPKYNSSLLHDTYLSGGWLDEDKFCVKRGRYGLGQFNVRNHNMWAVISDFCP